MCLLLFKSCEYKETMQRILKGNTVQILNVNNIQLGQLLIYIIESRWHRLSARSLQYQIRLNRSITLIYIETTFSP